MSKDCLHESFKAAILNGDLVKIGELRFKVSNSINDDIVPFAVQSASAFDAKIIGDGYFYKGSISQQTNITTEILETTNTSGYRLSPGEYLVSITPKYGLTSFNVSSGVASAKSIEMNLDDLQANSEPMTLNFMNNAQNVEGTHQPITGKLSSLPEKSLLNLSSSEVTGTMKDLAKLLHPNYAQNGAWSAVPSENIIGSVEDFVENAISDNYGKTIRLALNFYDTKQITFHDVVYNGTSTFILLDNSVGNAGNATVKDGSENIIATYTKSTNTWSYN